MDPNSLGQYSPKVMTVIETIRNDPDFLNEFKANPQEALNKIGVELNEDELAMLQKVESFRELGVEVTGIIDKVKNFFGIK